MRSTGTVVAAILFLWYLSHEIKKDEQPLSQYFEKKISKLFKINNDTCRLISHQPLIFKSKTDSVKISIDSLYRISDDKFLFKKDGLYVHCEYINQ